jgi:XTP/dITP diphosphohydrolase
MTQLRAAPKNLTLIIASHNIHKIREFRSMLKMISAIDVLSLVDFPNYIPPEETGSTFEENAILKAVHASTALKQWVIADDSGLIVSSIGGAPGVHSARFAGIDASDLDNRKKLLDAMQHLSDDDRAGYYECCIALASPEGLKKVSRGTCEGSILTQEKGTGGFGYDSLFVKNEYSKSFAELEESVKNRISHRRKAFDKMIPAIESLMMKTDFPGPTGVLPD